MKIELPLMRTDSPAQLRALVGTFQTLRSFSVTLCLASLVPGSCGQPRSTWLMPSSGSSVKCVECVLFMVTMSGFLPKPFMPL